MLLSIAYAPPLQFFAKFVGQEQILLESCEYYIKQTYRNRCRITSPGGLIDLTIPVESGASSACSIREVRISDHGRWYHRHWEAIRSSYGSSAFFEHYADIIAPFYTRRYNFLWDFNLEMLHHLLPLLGIEIQIHYTDTYQLPSSDPLTAEDFRHIIHPKAAPVDPTFIIQPYYQTFAVRHGFRPGLSILDPLFELGSEAILLLRSSIQQDSQCI